MCESHDISLSSILDLVYCKRRYYLRSVERLDDVNADMVLGKQGHEDVDKYKISYADGTYSITGMPVYSDEYDLYGICDVVEFIQSDDGVDVDFLNDRVEIVPVEYKHGKVRHCNEYIAQVVAQSLCLEEMFKCKINRGSIYFIDADEYFDFEITKSYRQLVYDAIDFFHEYDGCVIKPEYGRKCKGCAMFDTCGPKKHKIQEYMDELWRWD